MPLQVSLYERRVGGGVGYSVDRRGRGDVNTEAEIGVTWPQVKKCLEPPELERTDSLLEPLEELSLTNTWISGFWSQIGRASCRERV